MNTSRMKWSSLLLSKANADRRASVAARGLGCESLEGRQLLSGGMQGFGAGMDRQFGGPADVSGGWRTQSDGSGSGMANVSASASGTTASSDATTQAAGQGNSTGSVRSDAAHFAQSGDQGGARRDDFGGDKGGFGGGQGGFGGGQGMMFPGATQDASSTTTSTSAQGNFGGPDSFKGQGDPGDRGGFGDRGGMMMDQGGGMMGSTTDTSQLHTDFEKLRTDQQAIHDKSVVTPVMEAAARNDLKAVKGAETTTADATALSTLAADQKAAFANAGGPTDAQIATIQADQDAVYKSEGVSASLITQLDTDRQTIVTASNVTDADKATLAADKAAIQADMKAADAATATTSTTAAPNMPATDPGSSSADSTQAPAATGSGSSDPGATTTTTDPTATATPATAMATTITPAVPVTPPTPSSMPNMTANDMHIARQGFRGHGHDVQHHFARGNRG